MELLDQCFLRRAARAGIPLDCALVDRDRETEAGMVFRLGHDQLRGVVFAVVRTIPINDHAIDSAADHIGDLLVNLRRVVGTVPDVHVIRSTEPHHQVRVHLSRRAGIKQRVHTHLADIAGASVTIRLLGKTVRRAGVICRLRS